MRFAVAVVSPPDYQHGEAVREVAEGVHYALVALGYDSVLTDRLDLDERFTILLNPSVAIHYGLRLPKKPIFYNLEQVGSNWPQMAPQLLTLFRHYPVWDYSRANIEQLAAMDVPRPVYVQIGYVPELTRIAPTAEDIDVLFYGVINDRRRAVLEDLQARNIRVVGFCGVYGASRDAWVARSKIVLNIHHWETKVFEIARVSYLLANKRAVVSERGISSIEERELESAVMFAEYSELADRCVKLLADDQARRELAERGYQTFSSRSQTAILRAALSASFDT